MQNMADLTMKELAAILGFNFETLVKRAKKGKLPGSYKMGKEWRFRRECLDEIRGIKKEGAHDKTAP